MRQAAAFQKRPPLSLCLYPAVVIAKEELRRIALDLRREPGKRIDEYSRLAQEEGKFVKARAREVLHWTLAVRDDRIQSSGKLLDACCRGAQIGQRALGILHRCAGIVRERADAGIKLSRQIPKFAHGALQRLQHLTAVVEEPSKLSFLGAEYVARASQTFQRFADGPD